MVFGLWKEKLKNYALDIFTEKTTPHSIALGFAIGTLISILPTPGFNLLLALLVSVISKKVNQVSLFIGVLFWNPLTAPVIYYLSYKLGDLIFGATPIIMYDISFMEQVYQFTRRFLVGNILIAVAFTIISYFLVRWGATEYQEKNRLPSKQIQPSEGRK